MTRKELLECVREAAAEVYDPREADAVAWLFVGDAAELTRTDVLTAPDAEVAEPDGFDAMLRQLRAGRPVQYVLGRSGFCGLEFAVREGVLIPRPETEELVAWVAEEGHDAHTILDIGTGSGAIAVSLAARLRDAAVRATDISVAALEIAHENARRNGVEVELLRADILAEPAEWEGAWDDGTFDVIVSNPPYIPSRDLPSMHRNVTAYEPHTALFVPDGDPLVFYRAIARNAAWMLRSGGRLYFEIYEEFADDIRELLGSPGFADVEVRQDINGKNRMVRCRKI